MAVGYYERLEEQQEKGNHLWVGLDTDPDKIPVHTRMDERQHAIYYFNLAIVRATAPWTLVYKINRSYAQAEGPEGEDALRRTVEMIHSTFPGKLVIVDGKPGDIDRSAAKAAQGVFIKDGADATTVNPFMGDDAVVPFLQGSYRNRGVYVLCRTSNPSGGRYQDGFVNGEGHTVADQIAIDSRERWNNCGLVIGATLPEDQIARYRMLAPDAQILFPGIGKQGGDIEATVRAQRGGGMRCKKFLIGAASSVAGASMGRDYAEAAGAEARRLHGLIKAALAS